jgi:hypothetical protein
LTSPSTTRNIIFYRSSARFFFSSFIMHTLSSLLLLSSASTAWGYGWVANQAGVDASLLREARYANQKRQTSCPFNAEHKGAAPYTTQYPYTGAKNGVRGSQVGGIKVSLPDVFAPQ